ncbi:hypothetical protein DPMN_084405 [Dreissena polymorpha]|uniref:Uncharacterized protein n=1 Tax=Dreissena polymorpha TaxID=45954 RepID=A0A9D4BJ80_DREPO|nr:hypothetical protein DPMN_084405 [Dreissena polymorpha]
MAVRMIPSITENTEDTLAGQRHRLLTTTTWKHSRCVSDDFRYQGRSWILFNVLRQHKE